MIEMTMEEIQNEQIRNLKIINLCLDIPIDYKSNIDLDNSKIEFYNGCGNYANILRNMLVDDIKIEQIAEFLHISKDMVLSLINKHNWVK